MPPEYPSPFVGVQITTDVNMVEPGAPCEVRRTWRERLFSRPWRPLQATRTVVPMVPSRQILRFANRLVMHPTMLDELQKAGMSR